MSEFGSKRIGAIDVLRGVAVLGILLMNIQSFSMVESAYMNPGSYGDFTGLNAVVWALGRLFADQKFMTLFSLLFGAGLVLMAEKAVANGRRPSAAHYRRMVVLLGVGLAHAYLLWYGDILTIYAVCGLVVYLVRKWRPAILFGIGVAFVLVGAAIFGVLQLTFDYWPHEVMAEVESLWNPTPDRTQWQLDIYREGYMRQFEHRVPTTFSFQTQTFLMLFFWRVSGLMLIGMALFKWKVLGAYRTAGFYKRMLVFGLLVGLPIEACGMYYMNALDWDVRVMIPGMLFNYFSSLFIAAAYIGIVMLIHQSGRFSAFERKMSAVGRMAFTNYIMQTLICTMLFYGQGFGLFGHLERWQQVLVVVAVWVLQVLWSEWWLKRFENGPLEWFWRCATYMRVMPWRKRGESFSEDAPPVLQS
ncbi:MAG TPA: DUF418 domain-containing protein [Verrucomicrobiae bacterium]